MKKLRVLFMGTPDFAVPTLEALCRSEYDVVGVVTNPDRVAGRGKKITPPPVKVAAQRLGLKVFQPEKVRNNKELRMALKELKPDIGVVVAYGQILPSSVLNLPTWGCINVHASLLPKYRGASPIHAAIINGEEESGVSIMKMERGLDTGPVLSVVKTPILRSTNAQELHDTLSQLGGSIIVETIEGYTEGRILPVAQDDAASSYAPMMSKEDGEIDWAKSARVVDQLIRGVYPWPGAYTHFEHEGKELRTKIHRAAVYENDQLFNELQGSPGDIVIPDNDTLLVTCKDNFLQIIELQPAGKRGMSGRDFVNGFQHHLKERFY